MGRIYKAENKILVFNPLKRLVAICQSGYAAARLFKVSPQRVNAACHGLQISAAGLYFRELQNDIEVTFDDLGTLDVREYDDLCGVQRKVFKTKDMSKKGMKYNTKKKRLQQEAQQHED